MCRWGCGFRHVAKHRSGYCRDQVLTNCCEAQAVISARLMRFASGDPSAPAEAGLMIAEKVAAFAAAQEAAERALTDGLAVEQAYLPLRHRVHANSEGLRIAAH